MTEWTVVWEESAEIKLGNIWFGTGQSPKVTEASHQVDKALKADPHRHGKALAEGLMVIERPPLRAIFTISDDDRLVRVLSLSIVRV
jgi:hypothetical protein